MLDQGSFRNASEAIGLPLATVRLRVAALERDLGTSLLVRTNRGVQATEAGLRFAEGARRLLREADTLREVTTRERETVLGELRIRSVAGIPPQLIGVLSSEIHRRYPDLALWSEITLDPTRDIPDNIDVVVHFGAAEPTGPFRTFVVARFPVLLLATTGYLAAHGRPDSVDALSDHKLLSWIAPGEDGRRWPLRDGGYMDVAPWFLSTDPLLVRTLAAAGRGIAFLPDDELVRGSYPGEEFEFVLPEIVGRESTCHLLIPAARADTARTRAAIQLMRDLARGIFGVTLDMD